MDSDGIDNEIIPPGTDIVLAALQFTALGPAGETPEDVALLFQDGKYATWNGGPVLPGVSAPVQGFVTAIQNGAGITLTGIDIGPAAAAADFVQPELFATGGTLGVVMDLFTFQLRPAPWER